MKMVYSHNFIPGTLDLDYSSAIKPSALVNMMQDIASEHAATLGFGKDDLAKEGYTWVLSRIVLEFDNLVVDGESLQVNTWSKGCERLFALRDFIFETNQNQAVARASSWWLIIQKESRRPVRPNSLQPIPENGDIKPVIAIQSHLGREKKESVETFFYRIGYSDIDINQHVNNVRYVEWCMNLFSREFIETRALKSFDISFQAECLWGETIAVSKYKSDANAFVIEGMRNETKIFGAVVEWM